MLFALAAAVSMAVYFFQSAATSETMRGRGRGADVKRDGCRGRRVRVRRRSGDLPPVVLTWGGMIVGAAAIALVGAARVMPLRFAGSDVALFGGRTSWIVPVLGLGVVAAAIAYVTGIAAARRLGPKFGSFVAMAEIGFAVLFAWILLHQTPTALQFAGGGTDPGGRDRGAARRAVTRLLLPRLDGDRPRRHGPKLTPPELVPTTASSSGP